MEELFEVTVIKSNKSKMVKVVGQKINKTLSEIEPPLNDEQDILRLRRYTHSSGQVKLTYEISRGTRLSKKDQNRSPYREIGYTLKVGNNS